MGEDAQRKGKTADIFEIGLNAMKIRIDGSSPSSGGSSTLASAPGVPQGIPMVEQLDTTELRVKLSEARTDTKFAELLGEMRAGFARMDGRLDHLEKSTANIKTTVIGSAIGAVALAVAVLAYGQNGFGFGVSMRDVIKAAVSEYAQQHPPLPQKP